MSRNSQVKQRTPMDCDRSKNNIVGTMRHAICCPLIQSDGRKPCDCSPVDDAKAMTRADVLRIFQPLPPEEAEALKYLD